jgi:UDP-N-acetylmuramoylalanine--D-glutamate ligase
VREVGGVRYYNYSIASSPTRTLAALASFDRKVILIAGGYDKHIPFDALAPAVLEKVKALVLVGYTADKIESAVADAAGGGASPRVERPAGFEEAVRRARELPGRGRGAPVAGLRQLRSFQNFEARGERFREIVMSF